MMKKIGLIFGFLAIVSCQKKEHVDALVINAKVYTVNPNFEEAEAFAVKDGKFIKVGTTKEMQNKFSADTIIDAAGQTILPGLIDAHAHLFGLGFNQKNVNLVGTTSFEDVVKRVSEFQDKNKLSFIRGRGWDQNDWEDKAFPNKARLDELFPNVPIALTRIDGHAVLCNQAALDLGGVTIESKIEGGEVEVIDGKLTGILIDNAETLVLDFWPKPTRDDKITALLDAQKICFENGLTTVDDAGLDKDEIELIDSLQQAGDINLRIYAMVSASKKHLDYFLDKGVIKTEKLNVRSFKYYADGALGSRGAMLRVPYSDKPEHYGLMVTDLETFETAASRIANSEYQMNTHAIGDSANHAVLKTYKKLLEEKPGRRWRIEHAQIVSAEDFEMYKDILPSVQPTHATSDMYWAEDRVGAERIKGAYAYKQLLDSYGKIALGTDFPIEQVSPFLTFYAAVARQDIEQYPEGGFQMENALSREEALKGMTIWAAYSNFEEQEKGSIEPGKLADFIILDKDIMSVAIDEVPQIKVTHTFVNGQAQ